MSIKSYRSPKTEVRESSIGGKGLFAKESIKQGEIVFIKSGQIVGLKEALEYDKLLGDYSIQITEDFFLCPTNQEEVENTTIFVNHSCDPNVCPDGQVSFVALRDIKVGEELAYDYAMTVAHPYSLACSCGSDDCRGTITGDDWKRKDLQEKYGNHFSWLILKKIKKLD